MIFMTLSYESLLRLCFGTARQHHAENATRVLGSRAISRWETESKVLFGLSASLVALPLANDLDQRPNGPTDKQPKDESRKVMCASGFSVCRHPSGSAAGESLVTSLKTFLMGRLFGVGRDLNQRDIGGVMSASFGLCRSTTSSSKPL